MSERYPNHLVLLALRVTEGESQLKCAYRLGCAPKTISNWETGARHNLTHVKMRRVYAAYKVTPQVAQQRTAEYLADLIHEGRPHPEDHAAPQTGKPHISRFASCRDDYPNEVLGFGPKGGAITLHGALHAFLRDRKPMFNFHVDALIRQLEGRRMTPEQDLYHPDHKTADTDGESADLI